MRRVDPSVQSVIEAISPRNIYDRPVYRAVWSKDVMHWACGWWNDYNNQGHLVRRVFEPRYVPKYLFSPRWLMEKWHPPEFFGTPEMWEEVTAQYSSQHGREFELGPYPREGDYVFLWKCDDVNGKYLDLTPTLAQYTIELDMQPRPTIDQLIADAKNREARIKNEQRTRIVDECMDAFVFLGRQSNLNPRPLIDKIREYNKEREQ